MWEERGAVELVSATHAVIKPKKADTRERDFILTSKIPNWCRGSSNLATTAGRVAFWGTSLAR